MTKTLDRVQIDPELVAEATALGIDVDREVDVALRIKIDKKKRENAWREENREAIQEWNKHVEEQGLWYERLGKP
jgi:antitoxin CcdA